MDFTLLPPPTHPIKRGMAIGGLVSLLFLALVVVLYWDAPVAAAMIVTFFGLQILVFGLIIGVGYGRLMSKRGKWGSTPSATIPTTPDISEKQPLNTDQRDGEEA